MKQDKLRHAVMFRFAPHTTEADRQRVTDNFAALKEQVPGIFSFEWGKNISPEGLDQGFTHCYLMTFLSEADRDAYLQHPVHKAFGASIDGLVEAVFVTDWWTQES